MQTVRPDGTNSLSSTSPKPEVCIRLHCISLQAAAKFPTVRFLSLALLPAAPQCGDVVIQELWPSEISLCETVSIPTERQGEELDAAFAALASQNWEIISFGSM